MKRTMTAMVLTVMVATLAGAGTFAYFSDVAISTGNTFTSGTFGIELEGESLPLHAWNMMPGGSESEEHGVLNIGSIAGEVYITAENFVEPQLDYWKELEPDSIDVSAEEFAKILYMKIYADIDQDHNYEDGEIIYDGPLYGMETDRFGIEPEEYIRCKFVAYLPTDLNDPLTGENEDDNDYQADGVEFDIVFYADTEITIDG